MMRFHMITIIVIIVKDIKVTQDIIVIYKVIVIMVKILKVAWLLNLRGEGSSHLSGLFHSPTFQVFTLLVANTFDHIICCFPH